MAREEEDQLKIVRWLVSYPRLSLLLVLVIPLGLSAVGMLFFAQNDLQGWDVRSSTSSIHFDTFLEALEDVQDLNMDSNRTERSVKSTKMYLDLYYVAMENLLDSSSVLYDLKAFESEILNSDIMKEICWLDHGVCGPPLSVTKYLPQNPGNYSKSDFALLIISDQGVSKFSVSSSFDYGATDLQSLTVEKLRTRFVLGVPLPGFTDAKDRIEEQEKILLEKVQDISLSLIQGSDVQGVEVYFDFYDITAFYAFKALASDAIFGGGSIVIVLLMIGLHTRSVFLACCGLFQILLSFPTTFFIYRLCFGIHHFGTLQVLAIYVILGVGADDIFIYHDAMRQSKVMIPRRDGDDDDNFLAKRLSWAGRKAVGAMLVTSLTTFAAFFVTAMSPVINIRVFGIFASLLILVNFLLVICIWPLLEIIYEKHVVGYRTCMCCIPGECTKVEHDGKDTEDVSPEGSNERVERFGQVELFYRDKFAPVLLKLRWIIVVVVLCVVGVFTYYSTTFEPSSKQIEDIFKEDHPVSKVNSMRVSDFVFGEQASLQADLVFGLKELDRSTASLFDPLQRGTLAYHDTFDILDPEAQLSLYNLCVELNSGTLPFVREKTFATEVVVDCWIQEYKVWLETVQNGTFPLARNDTATSVRAWFMSVQGSHRYLQEAIFGDYSDPTTILPEPLLFTSINVILTGLKTDNLQEKLAVYDDLLAFVTKSETGFSETLGKPVVVSYDWVWLDMQDVLVVSSLIGLSAGVGFAFLVLLVMTRSLRLTGAATLAIISIVALSLGTMRLLGWQIGFMEAISITVLAGLACDFTVHIVIAYNEFKPEYAKTLTQVSVDDCMEGDFLENGIASRKLRTRCALQRVGVSIIGGAITTASAAVALSLAQIQYLGQFGQFLVMVILFALFISNVFLPAVLGILGPESNKHASDSELQAPPTFAPTKGENDDSESQL